MFTNPELGGESNVIRACPCETRFRRLFPLILIMPHLFRRSSVQQRTSLALGVGSSAQLVSKTRRCSRPQPLGRVGVAGSTARRSVTGFVMRLSPPSLQKARS